MDMPESKPPEPGELGHDPLLDMERDSIWSFGQPDAMGRPTPEPASAPGMAGYSQPAPRPEKPPSSTPAPQSTKPASKPASGAPAPQTFHLVTFTIGVEFFGINIKAIQEIIRHQEITPIPNVPPHVEGLINLRGRIMPVVNCRNRMGLPDDGQTTDHSRRIIIVSAGGALIGLMVDAVREVMYVPSRVVESPSSVTTVGHSDYLIGVAKLENKRLLVILDLDKLLAEVRQSVNTH